MVAKEKALYTIGHSTRTIEEFIAILHAHHITYLVDVRTIPKSRRVPWSNKEALAKTLLAENIQYVHMKELGGLRHAHKNSINTGWHNLSFRGYADYMQTPEFESGLEQLNQLVMSDAKVAIMCAEALPWRCHRSLLSDVELTRGIPVFHLMNIKSLYPHKLTAFAKVDDSVNPPQVTYPK